MSTTFKDSTDRGSRFLEHCLRVVGGRVFASASKFLLLINPGVADVEQARLVLKNSRGVVVAVQADEVFARAWGVRETRIPSDVHTEFHTANVARNTRPLRSLHSFSEYHAHKSRPLLVSDSGAEVWLEVISDAGGSVIFVGTDIEHDILLWRQGDPDAARNRPTKALWGIAGERPNYLFERHLEGRPKYERQADYWAYLLANVVAERLDCELEPMLPGGAPGAIVITGDDDQAYLEKYEEQLSLLNGTPITYFLHPLTKHTSDSMRAMFRGRKVELGIHPDALDSPECYSQLLREQCAWFERLLKQRAVILRNHGFLNDGYWGHLKPWLEEGLLFSSNLPGLDGRVLNNSLLPARLYVDGVLTQHWSMLTAIGDGVRFISGMSDEDAGRCVTDLADRIRSDVMPGVIVLNLHPQNVSETRAMHQSAMQVIESGFVAWTVSECMNWFARRDGYAWPVEVSVPNGQKKRSAMESLFRLFRAGARQEKLVMR